MIRLAALWPQWPVCLSYVLSFLYVGICWNNLHNMFRCAARVDGRILWANLHLLFWLPLMPVTTGFMGENSFAPDTVAVYGADLILCAIAYAILVAQLHRLHGLGTRFARAIGSDVKGKVSVALYALAIACTYVNQWISVGLLFLVSALWFHSSPTFRAIVAGNRTSALIRCGIVDHCGIGVSLADAFLYVGPVQPSHIFRHCQCP